MESLSIWHWVVVIITLGGSIMGIVRGIKNRSVLNAVFSVIIPIYGIAYFFVGKRQGVDTPVTAS
jgi:hypothetical protein